MAVLRNSMSIYNVLIGHYTRLILLAISRVNLYYTNFKISIKLFCQLQIFYPANCSFNNDIKLLPILCSLSTQSLNIYIKLYLVFFVYNNENHVIKILTQEFICSKLRNIVRLEVWCTPRPSFQHLWRAGRPLGPFQGPSILSIIGKSTKPNMLDLM